MGHKPTLSLRISASLGNRGPSYKGYKMRYLQMPLFWFISFVIGIKRIRDKTFCFNVRLGTNPHTQHTSCIHGAGRDFAKLCGIHLFEFPPLLLGKWATIGWISRTCFANCKQKVSGSLSLKAVAHLKRKTNKGALMSLKGSISVVSIWGSCLKLL